MVPGVCEQPLKEARKSPVLPFDLAGFRFYVGGI